MRSARWVIALAVVAVPVTLSARQAHAVPGDLVRMLLQEGESGGAPPAEPAAEPAPDLQGSYEQGRADGMRDGGSVGTGDWLMIGAGAACCLNAAGCIGAAVIGKSQAVQVPPRGVDPRYSPAYQSGYVAGYTDVVQQRRFKAALIGGGIATVIATIVSGVLYFALVAGTLFATQDTSGGAGPPAILGGRGLGLRTRGGGPAPSWSTSFGAVGAAPGGLGITF